jgi:hypothetical protein
MFIQSREANNVSSGKLDLGKRRFTYGINSISTDNQFNMN